MSATAQHWKAWVLVGPTAVGKSAVAQHLASLTGATILSADAMLVYRGMDIGTAKPLPTERKTTPYLGLDLVDPDQPFSVGAWLATVRGQLAASPAACEVQSPAGGTGLIVAGGTGLYVRTLLCGLDAAPADPARRAHWQQVFQDGGLPALQAALRARSPSALAALDDPENPRRVSRALERLDAGEGTGTPPAPRAPLPMAVGLRLPATALHARIVARAEAMLAGGLVEEAARLRQRYPVWSPTASQAIGYAEALALLDGQVDRATALARMVARTRHLAKRQMTWFRHQLSVVWVDVDPQAGPAAAAAQVCEKWSTYGPCPLVGI